MDLDSIVSEWYLGLYPPEKMPMVALWALAARARIRWTSVTWLAGRASATHTDEGSLINRAFSELGKGPLDTASTY
jgi:hypothetical protein